jgi:hypothetical protein
VNKNEVLAEYGLNNAIAFSSGSVAVRLKSQSPLVIATEEEMCFDKIDLVHYPDLQIEIDNFVRNLNAEISSGNFTLNIIPALFADYTNLLDFGTLSVSVQCEELEQIGVKMPASVDWKISQPYPNGRKYVAGCNKKIGWNILIPSHLNTLNIEIIWTYDQDFSEDVNVLHKIKVNLNYTDKGNVYTFAHTYPSGGINSKIEAILSEYPSNKLIDSFKGNGNYSFKQEDEFIFSINQEVTLSSISDHDYKLYYDTFEDIVLLRDIEPAQAFTTHIEQHQKNACCEMPTDILLDACKKAKIWESSGAFDKTLSYEYHPAIECLCDWWNRNTTSPHKSAGSFYIWVRVEDDNEYWCAYHETPGRKIVSFDGGGLCNARIGDRILIEFLSKKSEFTALGSNGVMVKTVDGSDYFDVGCPLEESDEAWYSYQSLLDFPGLFPAAYAALEASKDLLARPGP